LVNTPERLQRHTSHKGEKPLKAQLEDAARWFVNSNVSFSRLATLSYDVPAKLQDGPQCGIVAGWMAANALINHCQYPDEDDDDNVDEVVEQRHAHQPTLDELQAAAIEANFSRKGEMFTAEALADLITEAYADDFEVTATVLKDARSTLTSFEEMLDVFSDPDHHQLLLVVYDTGPDQRPCNLKGHKAHWGLVTGLATLLPPYHVIKSIKNSHKNHVENCDAGCFVVRGRMEQQKFRENCADIKKLFNGVSGKGGEKGGEKEGEEGNDKKGVNFELIVRQSKSKRLFFFDPQELANSCCNLREISPGGLEHFNSSQYVVPPGGIKVGLANKCILVRRPVRHS